jgi:predicted transcriptional regulator
MTITVRIDPDTEKLLNKLARSKRTNKSSIVREAIHMLSESHRAERSGTVYDRLKDLIGVIDTGGLNLSQDSHAKASLLIKKKHGRSR